MERVKAPHIIPEMGMRGAFFVVAIIDCHSRVLKTRRMREAMVPGGKSDGPRK